MKRIVSILLFILLSLKVSVAQKFYIIDRLNFSTRAYWELAAVEYDQGLVFLSNRSTSAFIDYSDQNNQDFSNIYYAKRIDEDDYESPVILSDKFVTRYHDGPAAFAKNGQMVCISRAYVVELGEGIRRNNPNGGLYFSEKNEEGEWSDPEPFEHNNTRYIYYTPYLTPDGMNLYFAANLDDSYGGFDLYISRWDRNRWTEPENLGNKVNTSQDDLYPYLHSSGRLYFSSKGHDAFGGADIFYCNNINNEWTDAVKLSSPINSGSDDYSLIISDDFSEGYFTSKRVGGTPDIYRFYSSFPTFDYPRPIRRVSFCYRLYENSMDTIDYTIFDYEWVINDTLKIPGHDIKYCFPGPGDYFINFNVTNKVTDTVMYGVASLRLPLDYVHQPVIDCPDTVRVNEQVNFSAEETYLPEINIDGYYWDFDDGMKEEGVNVRHYYVDPGRYKVVLGIVERVRSRRFEPEKYAVYKDVVVLPENGL
ncbi:MAG: PKD domain-containing protein [Bacteroidales bacterium]|nr:PKD domain-containing protein [Bacteroidales bacterium]